MCTLNGYSMVRRTSNGFSGDNLYWFWSLVCFFSLYAFAMLCFMNQGAFECFELEYRRGIFCDLTSNMFNF